MQSRYPERFSSSRQFKDYLNQVSSRLDSSDCNAEALFNETIGYPKIHKGWDWEEDEIFLYVELLKKFKAKGLSAANILQLLYPAAFSKLYIFFAIRLQDKEVRELLDNLVGECLFEQLNEVKIQERKSEGPITSLSDLAKYAIRFKDEVLDYIISIPSENKRLAAIKKALDGRTQLGRFFWYQRWFTKPSRLKSHLFELVNAYVDLAEPADDRFSHRLAKSLQQDMDTFNPSDDAVVSYLKLRLHNLNTPGKTSPQMDMSHSLSFQKQIVCDRKSPIITSRYLRLLCGWLRSNPLSSNDILTLIESDMGKGRTFIDLIIHFAHSGNTKIVNTFVLLLINCNNDYAASVRINNILSKPAIGYGWFDFDETSLFDLIRTKLNAPVQTIYLLWRYGFLVEEGLRLSAVDQQQLVDYMLCLPMEEKRSALEFACASKLFTDSNAEIRLLLGIDTVVDSLKASLTTQPVKKPEPIAATQGNADRLYLLLTEAQPAYAPAPVIQLTNSAEQHYAVVDSAVPMSTTSVPIAAAPLPSAPVATTYVVPAEQPVMNTNYIYAQLQVVPSPQNVARAAMSQAELEARIAALNRPAPVQQNTLSPVYMDTSVKRRVALHS